MGNDLANRFLWCEEEMEWRVERGNGHNPEWGWRLLFMPFQGGPAKTEERANPGLNYATPLELKGRRAGCRERDEMETLVFVRPHPDLLPRGGGAGA
jgi:hypothetical protein